MSSASRFCEEWRFGLAFGASNPARTTSHALPILTLNLHVILYAWDQLKLFLCREQTMDRCFTSIPEIYRFALDRWSKESLTTVGEVAVKSSGIRSACRARDLGLLRVG